MLKWAIILAVVALIAGALGFKHLGFISTLPLALMLLLLVARPALDDWQRQGRDALWVTHAGVIRAATLWWQGVALPASAADWPVAAPGYGQWLCLDSAHKRQNAQP
mgnify:CR=1 FL=1